MPESNLCNFYEINVSKQVGEEYLPFVEDVIRIVIIQIIYQIMFVIRSPGMFSIFDGDFIEAVFYLSIGVCVYWLVFKKLVVLK